MSLLLTFSELDKLYESAEIKEDYMDRETLIKELKARGKHYNFTEYTTSQLYRMWQRIMADDNKETATAAQEHDYENTMVVETQEDPCENCGALLADSGICPVCDEGEEELNEGIFDNTLPTSKWITANNTPVATKQNGIPVSTAATTGTKGLPNIVTIVYDNSKHRLRAQADDGKHGKGWVAFPTNLRTTEGQQYRVGHLIWNGKNYRVVGSITPVGSVSNTLNINETINKENYEMNFQTILEELDRLYEEDRSVSAKEKPKKLKEAAKPAENEEILVDEEPIVDDETTEETAAEVESTEATQLVLECENCGALVLKDEADIKTDEETGLVNTEETCQYCEESNGYKIIGTLAPYEASEGEVIEEGIRDLFKSKKQKEAEAAYEAKLERDRKLKELEKAAKHEFINYKGYHYVILRQVAGPYDPKGEQWELADDAHYPNYQEADAKISEMKKAEGQGAWLRRYTIQEAQWMPGIKGTELISWEDFFAKYKKEHGFDDVEEGFLGNLGSTIVGVAGGVADKMGSGILRETADGEEELTELFGSGKKKAEQNNLRGEFDSQVETKCKDKNVNDVAAELCSMFRSSVSEYKVKELKQHKNDTENTSVRRIFENKTANIIKLISNMLKQLSQPTSFTGGANILCRGAATVLESYFDGSSTAASVKILTEFANNMQQINLEGDAKGKVKKLAIKDFYAVLSKDLTDFMNSLKALPTKNILDESLVEFLDPNINVSVGSNNRVNPAVNATVTANGNNVPVLNGMLSEDDESAEADGADGELTELFGLGKKKSGSKNEGGKEASVTMTIYDENGTKQFAHTFKEIPGKMSAEEQLKTTLKDSNPQLLAQYKKSSGDWTYERVSNPASNFDTKRGRNYFLTDIGIYK